MSQSAEDFFHITHAYLERNRRLSAHSVMIAGRLFRVHKDVFSPLVFEDTAFFQETLQVSRGQRFLEVGCGCGPIAICAAHAGATVVATDINPAAVANTVENVRLQGVQGCVSVRHGDLFAPIADGERFDVIFWNVPFQRDVCDPSDALACSVFDPEYRSLRRFLRDGRSYLAPGGCLYFGFSSSSGAKEELDTIVAELNCTLLLRSVRSLRHDGYSDFSLELYQLIVHNDCVLA